MRIARDRAEVFPCATSANLGPGFDTLGLALELRDCYRLEVTTGSVEVVIEGEGAQTLPRDDSHLVIRAIRQTLEAVGAPQAGLRLTCRNSIPLGRGLGSSAAAIVGGIALARAILEEPDVLDEQFMLEIATDMEGHADNVAPALLGGVTLAYMKEGTPHACRIPRARLADGSEALTPVVILPSFEVSTQVARGMLPEQVDLRDAAFNAARAALLVHALSREPSALFDATADKLHQEARSAAMPATVGLVHMLRNEGMSAVVSGAGPTVLVLRGEARTIAPLVQEMVDDPTTWRIAQIPVAELGVRTVLG